jgi:hypothetical protein
MGRWTAKHIPHRRKKGRLRATLRVPPRGLEPLINSPGNAAISNVGGAESGAPATKSRDVDPDLAALIDAWPSLPEVVRAGIVAMVKAASGTER